MDPKQGIQVYVKRKMARTQGFGAPSPARRGWPRQIPPPLRVDDARRTTLLGLSSTLWRTRRGRPLAKGRRSRLRPRRGGFLQKKMGTQTVCRRPLYVPLSATSQRYFSLGTNQPLATSQQYSSLRTNQQQISTNHQPLVNRTGCISIESLHSLYMWNTLPK
jgi:hypothetical protein